MHENVFYLLLFILIIILSVYLIAFSFLRSFPLCLGHALFRYHYPFYFLILLALLIQGGLAFVRTSVSFCWNSFLSCENTGTSPMIYSMKIQRFLKSFLLTSRLKLLPCSARKLVLSSRRVPGNTLCLPPNYALTCRIKGKLWEEHRAMDQCSLQVSRRILQWVSEWRRPVEKKPNIQNLSAPVC